MDSAFTRHKRVHVAVPARPGSTAWAWVVTLRVMWESAVSLNSVVTWSVGCLVPTASRAHDVRPRGERAACILARSVDEARFASASAGRMMIFGRSQEGENRALRVLLEKSHSFLTSWLPLYRLF